MKSLLVLTAIFASCFSFGQLEELRKAQDTRKKYIQPGILDGSPANFDKLNLVDPFIGTGGHGHTYPGASMPFGMMQLSPDTRHDGWDGCSGYHYSDNVIYGFSHTHLSGTGVSDYGDLLIVPQNGKPRIDPGYLSPKGYGSTFSHSEEKATPGYYKVHLQDGDITARLTTTERAGMHQYIFNKASGKKFILIDLDHRDLLLSSSLDVLDKTTIQGSRVSNAWATEQHFYFYLKLDTPYQKARRFMKNGRHKLLLVFPKSVRTVHLKVGISAVDKAGAKKNLEAEIPHWNFNQTHAVAKNAWRKELNKVMFYSKDDVVMTNFYTALYHSYLNPNVFNDVDGRYRGRDNSIHTLANDEGLNYTVFSLWDTYRATHPLFTLMQTERTNDFIKTFMRQFDQGGDLPVWELAANETECMIGYHSVSVIADAYIKEIDDYNARKALEAMVATSNFDEFGKLEYNHNGFIGTSREPESVSKTLEYAYDNFCIHQMMKAYTQREQDYYFSYLLDTFANRSFNFINLYDPSSKFMRGRRSGLWFSPFDPAEVNFNYTEANSWQYSLYAPHAVGTLTELMGGKDSLEIWLDQLFSTKMELSGRDQADITGLIGQYAHGNEPSHHMAYLYNYTNHPEKTQFYVDSILYTMYDAAPDGLSGNEDCGQMSSWYVLSALGMYQIAPGRPIYEFGRPLMERASLQFENGRTLDIKVKNNSKSNKYIQRILLNGKPYRKLTINHRTLTNGGLLEFHMGPKPNNNLNKYSRGETFNGYPETFVPVPFFHQENRIFEEKMEVSLEVIDNDEHVIFYTTDGTDPLTSPSAGIYTRPFEISQTTTVKAYAADSLGHSSVISNEFVKKNTNVSIQLHSEYANQYAANGDFTLIDGVRGGSEFRTGDWQGYWDQDMVAEIHFKEAVTLSEIGVGVLADMKSWIFYPSEIIIEGSFDGNAFTKLATIDTKFEPGSYAPASNTNFSASTNTTVPFKKIRVRVKSFGECPEWHLGSGNPTWLFVDEIFFK